MSKLSTSLSGDDLTIVYDRVRKSPNDRTSVDVSKIETDRTYYSGIKVKSRALKNKILLTERIKGSSDWIVVYTNNESILYYRHGNASTNPLSRLISVKSKAFYVRLNRRGVRIVYILLIENKYNIPIKSTYLTISDSVDVKKKYSVYRSFPSIVRALTHVHTDYIPMSDLLKGEPPINTPVGVSLDIGDDQMVRHSISRSSRFIKSPREYYAPMSQTRARGYSVSIRRTPNAGLVLVRRLLEDVEKRLSFRILESRVVSFFMYHTAHLVRRFSGVAINIYFEKNANKADEGALDIFRKARDTSSSTRNFFILNEWSQDYGRLKSEKGVVKNFTLKSYWLIYRANAVIATEVPQHVNILRSGNKYIRLAPFSQKFIFLQHGIIYLKSLSKTTSFSAGREGEPDYIVVSSLKERDVVADLLGIEEERQLNVGLLAFDNIDYGHITNDSADVATIMLTWRSYEEHLRDFTKSSYYRVVMEIYEVLEPLLGKENIRIVAHPKFKKHLASTDIGSALWEGSIAEVLNETKLLITDYSSVCYNVFYRGGGVIFYQPDIEEYELHEGQLIPRDDEYVGHRALSLDELNDTVSRYIKGGSVKLDSLRTKEYTGNYRSINEHYDGRNAERLYDRLKGEGIF